MDKIHDLGGFHGFGPVPVDEGNYVFKHDWQRRSFGLAQALAGPAAFGADLHRQEIERLSVIEYLQMDYFEKWAVATANLVEQAGLANAEELRRGVKQFDVDLAVHPPSSVPDLVEVMKSGTELSYPSNASPPAYCAGQRVRVLSNAPEGHTRVPRYIRGHVGEVLFDKGVFQFADSVAARKGPQPQHCYTVSFRARELWGDDAEADDAVNCDLWESYLVAA